MNIKRRKNRFDFKQFSIVQEASAMKVGTDGVLLGAWANVGAVNQVLDIGTGTGLIALMVAQRTASTKIDAIEIDAPSFAEATINVSRSPWQDRITVIKGTIQEFSQLKPRKYDLIISNPPFFAAGTASPADNRHQARHDGQLSQKELIHTADKLLYSKGRFCIILPVKEGEHFIKLALKNKLFLHRQTAFFPKVTKPQERWLLEFQRQAPTTPIENTTLIQYNQKGEWSSAYKSLTKDFYLKL